MSDEEEDQRQHFSLKKILESEKQERKRGKKRRGRGNQEEVWLNVLIDFSFICQLIRANQTHLKLTWMTSALELSTALITSQLILHIHSSSECKTEEEEEKKGSVCLWSLPHFRATKGMKAILSEKQRRRDTKKHMTSTTTGRRAGHSTEDTE